MRKLKRVSLLTRSNSHVLPVGQNVLLGTDGYESAYERGTEAGTQFVTSLRFRKASGQIIVPSEFGRIIERSMIRWDAAGGSEMSVQPLAQRTAEFETVRGEMYGFSAGLIAAF